MATFQKIPSNTIDEALKELRIKSLDNASIRQIVALANMLEAQTGIRFIRMEMGVPGLPACQVGVEAEINALKNGVASKYPLINGIPQLKQACSNFVKKFMDIDILPDGCIPTVGSMQATYTAFLAVNNLKQNQDTTLFLDPGFPVQKQQMKVLGLNYKAFDIYKHRGNKLEDKLRSYLEEGNISSVIYSNPNNPSWMCLTDKELEVIGRLSKEFGFIVLEDLAYFGMDTRENKDTNNIKQATVAKYTDNYILFLSSSKIFSYAGQRCGMIIISDYLYNMESPKLEERFGTSTLGDVIILKILYALSSGVSHSAQYALAAMLEKSVSGELDFIRDTIEYSKRAKEVKAIFEKYDFYLVYTDDLEIEIGDGFYFTLSKTGLDNNTLMKQLLQCGISAISLKETGSEFSGIRACVSNITRIQIEELDRRLSMFDL
ncbi:MAG: aminotransferase class I/II-fold pyridoxal phosphate-dependent enzyme [Bacteroidales bacterium]